MPTVLANEKKKKKKKKNGIRLYTTDIFAKHQPVQISYINIV